MKKIIFLIATILMMYSLTACGQSSNIINMEDVLNSPNYELADFEVIDYNFYGAILVDKNTKVLYYWITSDVGGITPIYNTDGSLKLFKGYEVTINNNTKDESQTEEIFSCPYCSSSLDEFSSSGTESSVAQLRCYNCGFNTPNVHINKPNAKSECIEKCKENFRNNNWTNK